MEKYRSFTTKPIIKKNGTMKRRNLIHLPEEAQKKARSHL
jgi:hypothetical protein